MLENFIALNDKQKNLFDQLYRLIIASPVNVTAIKEKQDFEIKHLLDSLWFFEKNKLQIKSVADVGSGGGFPGIPLAICLPDISVTLIESIAKKCHFLNLVIAELGLNNVNVVNDRAEKIKGLAFDLVTARGVGTVNEVLKLTVNLVHDSGGWLMYKGERLSAELAEAARFIEMRGLKSEITRVETPFTRTYLHLHY